MSQMELEHVYHFVTEVENLNGDNLLKPYGYQQLFSTLAEQHLFQIDLNVDRIKEHDLAWVLITMSLEVVRPVKGCIKLHAKTWHSARQGPYFRRELVFYHENGDLAFQGSTFSVLLDMTKRTIYRKRELPFQVHQPWPEFVLEATPSWKNEGCFTKVETRVVRNSQIDALGHVNNSRYGEFAYDALDQEEVQRLNRLARMDINFHSELRIGDSFAMEKATEGNRVLLRGVHQTSGTPAFDYALTFR